MFSKKILNFLPPITVEYLLLKQGSIGAQKWGWVHGPADWIQQTYVVGLAPHIRISIISCKWKKKSYKHDLSQIKKRRRSCEKKRTKGHFWFRHIFSWPRVTLMEIDKVRHRVRCPLNKYLLLWLRCYLLGWNFCFGGKMWLEWENKSTVFSEFDFGPEFLMYQHPCNFT